MSTHDPFRPVTQHASRVFVEPPPDPGNDVPGHEDEAIRWMLAPIGLDTDATNGPDEVAELVRRTDLVETTEFTRPGSMRDRIMAAVAAARASHGATAPGEVGSNIDGIADRIAAIGDEDLKGDPEAEGDGAEDDAVANAEAQARQDTADGPVPAKAAEIVAWIQAGPNGENQARRAQRAWAAEIDRPDGVRSTVQTEVDRHLAP